MRSTVGTHLHGAISGTTTLRDCFQDWRGIFAFELRSTGGLAIRPFQFFSGSHCRTMATSGAQRFAAMADAAHTLGRIINRHDASFNGVDDLVGIFWPDNELWDARANARPCLCAA